MSENIITITSKAQLDVLLATSRILVADCKPRP